MRMRMRFVRGALVTAAVLSLLLGGSGAALADTPAPNPSAAPTGTLELTNPGAKAGEDLVFRYSTDTPAAKNWVGVYATPSDGPTDQTYHKPSTAYAYTGASTSGTVTVSGSKLTAGHAVTAYLLYDDGYRWLAEPVTFTLSGTTAPPTASGALSLETKDPVVGDPLVFHYATSTPNSLNWIGIYNDPADGPTDQTYHSASTRYTYVQGTDGTATIPSGGLTSGHDIAAYLLYNDGYTWLATPITFTVKDPPPYDPTPTTAHFVLPNVTAAATPPDERVRIPVGGWWFGAGGTAPSLAPEFSKTGGSAWLRVSASGTVTGTAPRDVGADTDPGWIEVTARDSAGATGSVTVDVPLVPRGTAPTLKAATLSMWEGGTHVDGTTEKLTATVLRNGLDAVGLQDTSAPGIPSSTTVPVAKALGWSRVESGSGVAILSRYPLGSTRSPKGLPGISARADVAGHGVRLWSLGLDADDFGPTVACSGYRGDLVLREQASLRSQQAVALAKEITAARANGIPEVVLGSLESPAASDWTRSARAQHCGKGPVAWPVPAAFADAKLVDSFRSVHANPVKEPGATQLWIPAPTATTDAAERIDYVDYTGELGVAESHVLVDGFPASGSRTNAWISNRAAVVTTFTVGPAD